MAHPNHLLDSQLAKARDRLQLSTEGKQKLAEEVNLSGQDRLEDDQIELFAALKAEVRSLHQELKEARALVALHQAESETWRARYEELKPQLTGSAARVAGLLDTMRQELSQITPNSGEVGQSAPQFRASVERLPGTLSPVTFQESRVVFNGSKLPLLSKAAVNICNGGFAYFGDSLIWCDPPSQHACVCLPQYHYNAKPSEGEAAWTSVDITQKFSGQQRELFFVDGGNISYAGTFLCQAGPKTIKISEVQDIASEDLVQDLARKTFRAHSQSQKAKAKTYLPPLASLYREGTAAVQMLGLQRIGFNDKLFAILRRAYSKRTAALAHATDVGGDRSSTPQKRTCPHGDVEVRGHKNGGPGPSKVPRLDAALAGAWEVAADDLMSI